MLEINGGNTNNDYIQETIEPEESNTSIEIPDEFELINEDIYELLSKEEFFYNNIEEDKDKIFYEILFGNNQIIIKNKNNENNENNFLNTYLIYIYNNEYQNKEKYLLKYILDYENNSIFFDNFGNIIEEGLNNFISKNDININDFNLEQKIYDNKKNVLGKFVNIGILSNDEILNIIDRKNSIINSNIILNKKNKEKYKKKNVVSKNERFLLKNILDKRKYYNEKNIIENNTSFSYEINNRKKEIFDSQKLNIINNEIEINLESEYKNNIKSINTKNDIKLKVENFHFNLNRIIVEHLTEEPEINEFKIENIEKINYKPTYIKNKSKIINIDNNCDYLDNDKINFDKLKRKMNILEPFLKEIYKKFRIDKKIKNLEIESLIPDEIIQKKESPEIFRILIIKEKDLKEIKSALNYDLINKYIDSKKEGKNEILENNLKEFDKINQIIKQKQKNPKKLPLIENYDECIIDIEENRNFFIIYNDKFKDIYPQAENIFIYYFEFNGKSFIFFEKDKQILELINNDDEKNNLYRLKKYGMNELEMLKLIRIEAIKNKDISDSNKNEYINRNIKDYYIINNKWINSKINNIINSRNSFFDIERIKPQTKIYLDDLEYPIEFDFLEKEKYEPIFKDFANINPEIILDDIYVSKIFFVIWQNNIPESKINNNIYLGIILLIFYLILMIKILLLKK